MYEHARVLQQPVRGRQLEAGPVVHDEGPQSQGPDQGPQVLGEDQWGRRQGEQCLL
jgi:hypothetical protein